MTISRRVLWNVAIALWGIPGFVYMFAGMYLTFNSALREPALGAAILIFYVAILLPKRTVNAHIKYVRESKEDHFPIKKITSPRLFFIWFFHLLLPWLLYLAFGKDSILFLSVLDIVALTFLTYSYRYILSRNTPLDENDDKWQI